MTFHVVHRVRRIVLACCLAGLAACSPGEREAGVDADVIIVGAGLAGLSAAIDAASGGADVLVIDMNSVFGGHGIQSGGVAVVGSPLQVEQGFQDTPEVAYADWMEWTIDGHAEWTRFYAEHSRELIYDWVTGLGVRFDRIIPSHGNSVPRFHMTYRRGLNLMRPLYLEALRYSNIRFRWNMTAQHLLKTEGRVVGVQVLDLRRGEQVELHAAAVILATGGFESNIEMVTENWPENVPPPDQIYSMSGQHSRGTGHVMASEAGAALVHMDRQYNGYAALPNMLGLDKERGFVSGSNRTIWVNSEGKRFVTENGVDRDVFPVVMQQNPPGYWRIFDEDDKRSFRINSPHFVAADAVDQDKIQREVIDNPEVTVRADTVEALADAIGVRPEALVETVEHHNAQMISGENTDLNGMAAESPPPVFTIDAPPFYAMRTYPMANKSAGGVSIDMHARALDAEGRPVAGLYAAGEVTGSAGINGVNGLDGMFTGPAILTGRVAGRTVVADLEASGDMAATPFMRDESMSLKADAASSPWQATLDAEGLAAMLAVSRDGYWHFERVHELVLERDYQCTRCHSSQVPFAAPSTHTQRLAQAAVCDTCHLAPAGTLDPTSQQPEAQPDAQAIVVGAGPSGLSAAVEMGQRGVEVLVVDMNSVPGGTAVRAGGVAIVGTPVQERAGIQDSSSLAYQDWMQWTEEGDPGWSHFYAENSRAMIYDWLTEMGVEFVRVAPGHGNSVRRFHFTEGRAVHLILPLYRTALGLPNVSFLWNVRADSLLVEDGRVGGVVVRDLRRGDQRTLRAPNIVLATGGFESDLDRVLANWTPGLPRPDRLMIGSSVRATGSGHNMATDAGAALSRIDRHYIYINGLPDPRDAEQKFALTAGNEQSMWVNASGERFTNEMGFDKDILVDLLQQQPSTYWMIFDAAGRSGFGMRGAAWLKNSSEEHVLLDDPHTTKQAQTLEELAAMAGLPADSLIRSVARFNVMIDAGEDTDFGRFANRDEAPARVEVAPFYALQMFPMTRKNMGGVAIDRQARALDKSGRVLPGLYAVGELNGSLGINGKYGLDGMFLGPAILSGRVAAQSIVAATATQTKVPEVSPAEHSRDGGEWQAAMKQEHLAAMLSKPRDGYWHFQVSHALVVERSYECGMCHSAELPFSTVSDRGNRLLQTEVCTTCH